MRILTALSLAFTLLAGAASSHAHHITGRGAKSFIVKGLMSSSKVSDKTGPFKTKLGGKAGDIVRPFSARNIRAMILPGKAPAGAQGGFRMSVGGIASGTINMATHRVKVTSYTMVR